MTTKRSLAVLGLVIGLAVTVAGCGGGEPFPTSSPATAVSPSASPRARLLAAVQHATESKTARVALSESVSGLGAAGAAKISGEGVMDLARRRFMMTMHGGGAAAAIALEIRVVDSTVYVKAGDGWTSVPVTAAGTNTPVVSNYLDYLQGISGDVRADGREKLRGDDTTRYRATVDLGRAMARVGDATQRETIKHALDLFGISGMPVTVWVDDVGRLRKLELSFDLGAIAAKLGAPAGSQPKIGLTIELYDFGIPVDVRAPSAAEPAVTTHRAESDLRNALTAEKVQYTDTQEYTADASALKEIEPSLDWGGKLTVVVGSSAAGTNDIVCLSERSGAGVFAVADVQGGPRVGTYTGKAGCPSVVNAVNVSKLGPHW